jgi:hypothetical protein
VFAFWNIEIAAEQAKLLDTVSNQCIVVIYNLPLDTKNTVHLNVVVGCLNEALSESPSNLKTTRRRWLLVPELRLFTGSISGSLSHQSLKAMATAAIQVPPSNKILPGSRLLATVPYPQVTESTLPTDPGKVASDWITSFNRLINHGDSAFSTLFLKESCWRDLLCLTWDFHTLQGPEKIAASIGHFAKECRIKCINLDTSSDHKKPKVASADFAGNMKAVQAFLEVETDVGKGKGLVRLLPDSEDGQRWKAFTLLTTLQELKGYEESTNRRRPTGVESDLDNGRRNWKDLRIAEENFEGDREPVVLILGIVDLPVRDGNRELTLLNRRCGTSGSELGCTTEAARSGHLNHRPKSSRWRQLAKSIPPTSAS